MQDPINLTNDEALEMLEGVIKAAKLNPDKESKILANIRDLHSKQELPGLIVDLQIDILRAKNNKKYDLVAKIIENLRNMPDFDVNKINDLAMKLPELTIEEIADLPNALKTEENVN